MFSSQCMWGWDGSWKANRHKSPSIDQISTELIKAVGRTSRFEKCNLTNSAWNKEELPEQWKLLFIVPIYKKCDCWGILLLSTTCRILSNILLSSLTPYAGEIFKKAYCSVSREVLSSILIEFGIPMKLVRLIKVCMNETFVWHVSC
jgi:hypothetical protein